MMKFLFYANAALAVINLLFFVAGAGPFNLFAGCLSGFIATCQWQNREHGYLVWRG